jgi:lysozyme family protein
MDINKAFSILMDFEGGISNADKGGLTKFGISQKAYPDLDIENLTTDQARVIYEKDYWNYMQCSELPEAIRYIVFDTGVNMGVNSAIKILQKAECIQTDGLMGNQTLNMSSNVIPIEYLLHRLLRYIQIATKDPSQLIFMNGWANRITKLSDMSKAGKLE